MIVFAALAALLFLPALAILRLPPSFDRRFVFCYAGILSIIVFLLYRHDKRQAMSGGWRTPESTLHFVELIGGWPGAFLAQRLLRHKNAKGGYQLVFWIIVVAYQFVAFDFFNDWQYLRKVSPLFRSQKTTMPMTEKGKRQPR